jgi:hypothetical protein
MMMFAFLLFPTKISVLIFTTGWRVSVISSIFGQDIHFDRAHLRGH